MPEHFDLLISEPSSALKRDSRRDDGARLGRLHNKLHLFL